MGNLDKKQYIILSPQIHQASLIFTLNPAKKIQGSGAKTKFTETASIKENTFNFICSWY
jgi:hypothetical protein